MLSVLWWLTFTVACIWGQSVVPGVDLLAPGLIILLQEDRRAAALWLVLLWIPLQDGMGNLASGYSIMWYCLITLFFYSGRWLFEARSALFMILLGVALGALHVTLTYAMVSLQFLVLPVERVLWEGLIQAVIFPIEWSMLDRIYPQALRRHDEAY